jgi:single-stranded-DNA-specific exonuclease
MKPLRWKLAETDALLAADLARQLQIPPLFARCLANRGCSSADRAEEFLEPKLAHLSDPFILPDMERAVDRLVRAREIGECFVIFGDYDVDGVTATTLLTEFFRSLGWTCFSYLPHRLEEGYGLTRDAIQNCLERFNVNLILAVDCGSSAAEVIEELRARNIEVIILDHHQVSSRRPSAVAFVNPQLLDREEHLKSLCSAGLAFKLAHALLKRGRSLGWQQAFVCDLREYLDLVALGTIADLVPLQNENRTFARIGLQKLTTSKRPGIRALKQVAGLEGAVGSYEVAFQLAPRLNAAGRLETALHALELLLTQDGARAESLAAALDKQNRERQSLEEKMTQEVFAAVRQKFNPETDFAIVEGESTWHLGVVGIVASRVMREFYRPAVILGSDGSSEWRGSGRSIEGFDLAAGLAKCSDLLLKHGGHAMAAGVTIASSSVHEFRKRLNDLVRQNLVGELLPSLRLDGETTLDQIDFAVLKLLEKINPSGQGNPPVQLVARNLHVKGEPNQFGGSKQHLRFSVSDGRITHQAVWWRCSQDMQFPRVFDLAFTPELNEYNGSFAVQLKILDLREPES